MASYDLTARRRFSREEKAAIVAESLRDGAVSAVARRHRVAPAQLFRWRRELGGGPRGSTEAIVPAVRRLAPAAKENAAPVMDAHAPPASMAFVPAVLAAPGPKRARRRAGRPHEARRDASVADEPAAEIVFPNGCVLKVRGDLHETRLSRLIRALCA